MHTTKPAARLSLSFLLFFTTLTVYDKIMIVRKGNVLVILAVIFFVAIGAEGYFYWQNRQKLGQKTSVVDIGNIPTKSFTPSVTYLPTKTPTPSIVVIDKASGLKIFANTKYGFELKYPAEWEFKPCQDIQCGSFTEISTGKTLIDLEVFDNQCGVTMEPSFMNAEKATRCLCASGGVIGAIECDNPSGNKTITNKNGVTGYYFFLRELLNDNPRRIRGPYIVVFFPKPVLRRVLYEYGLYFEVLDKSVLSKFEQVFQTFKLTN